MTDPLPLVSVVMPVYNGARTIERAVDSVLAQTYPNFECHVLDNCSIDGTSEIVERCAERDPRIRVHRNPEVFPVMRNHNAAVELMSPDSAYCQILQADDTLAPECLRRKVRIGEAHPTVGAIGGYSDRAGDRYPRCMPGASFFTGHEVCRRTLLGEFYPFISPSSVLFRASVVGERRPFYNESDLHGDVQACYEILAEHDFGFVHDVLTHVGVSRGSVTSRQTAPLNRLLASNFDLLVSYGPRFLSEDAYAARRAEVLAGYYRQLALAVLDRRGLAYWRFHREALAAGGSRLSLARLLGALSEETRARPTASIRRFARSFGSG